MLIQKLKNIYHLCQSLWANLKYGFPAGKLKIIGVTGTDGKTTSVTMIFHILKKCGFKVGMISTVHIKYNGREIDSGLHVTTPDPWETPRILREMLNAGIEYVVIEATSSGLDQNRLFGVRFETSMITFIGSDHLDYHRSQESYARAKYKLVKMTRKNGLIVLNKDHKSNKWLKNKIKKRKGDSEVNWYSIKDLQNREHSSKGLTFSYKQQKFHVPIIGEYNFHNCLGVLKVCEKYVKDLKEISRAMETFLAPLGRMQIVQKDPFLVIIDFAHTYESLSVALKTVISLKRNGGKIITVFGCAGRRDHQRRRMGEVSAKLADITIITIEDSRDEDLKVINDEIIRNAQKAGAAIRKRFNSHDKYKSKLKSLDYKNVPLKSIFSFDYPEVQNRKDAIDLAFQLAQEGDIIFITGKAHERSLAIGERIVEYKYSDVNTVKNLMSKNNFEKEVGI